MNILQKPQPKRPGPVSIIDALEREQAESAGSTAPSSTLLGSTDQSINVSAVGNIEMDIDGSVYILPFSNGGVSSKSAPPALQVVKLVDESNVSNDYGVHVGYDEKHYDWVDTGINLIGKSLSSQKMMGMMDIEHLGDNSLNPFYNIDKDVHVDSSSERFYLRSVSSNTNSVDFDRIHTSPSVQWGISDDDVSSLKNRTNLNTINIAPHRQDEKKYMHREVIIRNRWTNNDLSGIDPDKNPIQTKSAVHQIDLQKNIVMNCVSILNETSAMLLKAVELANALRARVGQENLVKVRERWGGLLLLLEMHNRIFQVHRIPKNDMVELLLAPSEIGMLGNLRVMTPPTTSGMNAKAPTISSENNTNSNNQGQPSSCLHVGNIPANYTKTQLHDHFQKIDGVTNVTIINHRCRRFAFVAFSSIEQADRGKDILSKTLPWNGTISYSYKDTNKEVASDTKHNTACNEGVNSQHKGSKTSPRRATAIHQRIGTRDHLVPFSDQEDDLGQCCGYDDNFRQRKQPTRTMLRPSHPVDHLFQFHDEYSDVEENLFNGLRGHDIAGISFASSGSAMSTTILSDAQHKELTPQHSILVRLCDATFVPTKNWSCDIADRPICNAIVSELRQFKGPVSISKLRSALKIRFQSRDNIKSVPLKAFLCAYPDLFLVRGNTVSAF